MKIAPAIHFLSYKYTEKQIIFNLFDKEFSWYGAMDMAKFISVLNFFKLQ